MPLTIIMFVIAWIIIAIAGTVIVMLLNIDSIVIDCALFLLLIFYLIYITIGGF